MGNIWNNATNAIYDFGKSTNKNQQYNASQELSREDIPEILRSVSIFSHLSLDEAKELVSCMRYRTYKYNQRIIQQGEDGHEFYLICSGLVKVLIKDIHNNGKQKQVATLKTGDTFGETSLITDKPRNATIQCMQDTKVLYCDKYTFLAITNKNQKKKVANVNMNANEEIIDCDQKEGKEDNTLEIMELMQKLNEYGLSRFRTPLIKELGVESLSDLKYCEENDLRRIGCKVVQIRKLKEIAQKYANSKEMNCNDQNQRNTAYVFKYASPFTIM